MDVNLLDDVITRTGSQELQKDEQDVLNQYFHDIGAERQKKSIPSPNLHCSQEELLRRAFFVIEKASLEYKSKAPLAQANAANYFAKFSMFNSLQHEQQPKQNPKLKKKEIASWVKNLLKRF